MAAISCCHTARVLDREIITMPSDTFIIRIESLAYGGKGVGRRADGKVVFIPQVLPGEIVRACSVREHPSYCEAHPEEILQTSESRTTPRCELFDACGGCDWQHIVYPEQLKFKNDLLARSFRKAIPDITPSLSPPVEAVKTFAYRCHARLHYRRTPQAMLGFYQKRTHSVLACRQCPVLNPRLQAALEELNDAIRQTPLPGITALEIYAPEDEFLLLAHTRNPRAAQEARALKELASRMKTAGCHLLHDPTRRMQRIMGQAHFTYRIETPARTFRLSGQLGGFIQANQEMNGSLVRYVMDQARGSERVLDLYGGCGNFGLPLAYVAQEVVVVERDRRLTALGSGNAERNRLSNIRFITGDVMQAMRNEHPGWFDTVVLDPPREGAKAIVPSLSLLKPARIIYVSCNPMTLARDIGMLHKSGYLLKRLKLFDMFPQTYHIESVALLECA